MRYWQLNSEKYLRSEYLLKKRRMKDMAKEIGCNIESLRLALKRNSIPTREARNYTVISISKKQLIYWYVKQKQTAYQISRTLHCCEHTISKKLRAYGIPTKRRKKQDLRRDLTNERIGKLLVRRKHHQDPNGDIFWECDCDCGNRIVTRARNLVRFQGTRSCGCAKSRVPWKIIPQFVWCGIESRARNRNIPFLIDREFGESLFLRQNGKCSISGLDIHFASKRKEKMTTASLDRIDSSKGYTKDNVQWVHKMVNMMKQHYPLRDFVVMCKTIAIHATETERTTNKS